MTLQHRVVIYISAEDYKKLRIKLLEKGTTASAWFREQVSKYLKSNLTNQR